LEDIPFTNTTVEKLSKINNVHAQNNEMIERLTRLKDVLIAQQHRK